MLMCTDTSYLCADSKVLDALSAALHPVHGTVVMNLHGGGVPTMSALMDLFTGWLPFASKEAKSGYHQSTEKGRAVQSIAHSLRWAKSVGSDRCSFQSFNLYSTVQFCCLTCQWASHLWHD